MENLTSQDIREQLKKLSIEVKPLIESGQFETVNEGIINTYTDSTHQNFKLFHDWRRQGFKIIKGSKGFPVWTRKRENQKVTETGEVDEYNFFGVCFLFSNAQVEPIREMQIA